MKLNKKLLGLTLGAAMLLTTSAMAQIAPNEVVLGGIYPGMTLETAKSVGGTIAYSDSKTTVFQNGIIVKVDTDRPNVVEEVLCRKGSAATPAGIKLGMADTALTNAYGQADKVDRDYDDTEYVFRSTDGTKSLEFSVVNGVIVKISCELKD